jgi:hypothetical protein
MFFVTTSIVCASLSVGLNSTTLGAGEENRRVTRAHAVGVSGLEDLLGAFASERHLPLDHVAHVLALTLIIGQSPEEWREVGVLRIGLKADRPAAVEVLEVTLVASTDS